MSHLIGIHPAPVFCSVNRSCRVKDKSAQAVSIQLVFETGSLWLSTESTSTYITTDYYINMCSLFIYSIFIVDLFAFFSWTLTLSGRLCLESLPANVPLPSLAASPCVPRQPLPSSPWCEPCSIRRIKGQLLVQGLSNLAQFITFL